MPLAKKLLTRLAEYPHETILHKTVYTAYDLVQTLGVKLEEVAKTLLIKTEKGFVMVLVSAGQNLDLKKLSAATGAKKISIPQEKEIIKLVKTKRGPITSFGSMYHLPVFLDKNFSKTKTALFSGGSFTESIQLKLKDFIKMESPTIGQFGVVKKFKKQKPTRKKPSSKKPIRKSMKKKKPTATRKAPKRTR